MATPIGHSLFGALLCLLGKKTRLNFPWALLTYCIFCANVPDADFLPGILAGNPNLFHHGLTHSLSFGFIFVLLACAITLPLGWVTKSQLSCFFTMGDISYVSHLFLDYVTLDDGSPYGIPLFWPFSKDYLTSSFYVFGNVVHSDHVISRHNLEIALVELLLFSPAFVYLFWLDKRLHRGGKLSRFLPVAMFIGLALVLCAKRNPYF